MTLPRSWFLPLASASLLLAAGCSAITSVTPDAAPRLTSFSLTGTVHGGQAPIIGSHIHLMAASASAYGAASASLLESAKTGYSDSIGAYVPSAGAHGSWSITGDYNCSPGQIVYVLATQGNPGLPGNTNNAAISLMAVLGPCPGTTFSSALTVNISEATTVAGAYALAGFMTDQTHLASSGTSLALTGITNAAANAGYLADLSTGKARTLTPNTFGTPPYARLNALANILSTCVDSDGTTPCATASAETTCCNSRHIDAQICVKSMVGAKLLTSYSD